MKKIAAAGLYFVLVVVGTASLLLGGVLPQLRLGYHQKNQVLSRQFNSQNLTANNLSAQIGIESLLSLAVNYDILILDPEPQLRIGDIVKLRFIITNNDNTAISKLNFFANYNPQILTLEEDNSLAVFFDQQKVSISENTVKKANLQDLIGDVNKDESKSFDLYFRVSKDFTQGCLDSQLHYGIVDSTQQGHIDRKICIDINSRPPVTDL